MIKRAKITQKGGYRCAPEGHTVVSFGEGVVVEGQVAEWAIADHAGQAMFDPRTETKITPPTEIKVAHLKGGSVDKGGHNKSKSQVTKRPPKPTPTVAKRKAKK